MFLVNMVQSGGQVEIRNDTRETCVVYGIHGDRVTLKRGERQVYGCPAGSWIVMGASSGDVSVIPWIVAGAGGGPGGSHTLQFYFNCCNLSEIQRYLTCNWEHMVETVLGAVKGPFQAIANKMKPPNLGRPKRFKVSKAKNTKKFKKHFDSWVPKDHASGQLHHDIHQLREEYESVRFGLLQLEASLADIAEMFNTPKELKEEAKALERSMKVWRQVAKRLGNSGPIGRMFSSSLEKVLQASEKSMNRTSKTLDNVHKRMNLESCTKKTLKARDKLMKSQAFKLMQKGNKQLANAEKQSAKLGNEWPEWKRSAPNDVANQLDEMFTQGSKYAVKASQTIAPMAKQMEEFRKNIAYTSSILAPKRTCVAWLRPITQFYRMMEPVLNQIMDLLNKILGLPVIKQVMNFFDSVVDFIWNKICEWTGIDRLFNQLADSLNPFKGLFGEEEVRRAVEMFDPERLLREMGAFEALDFAKLELSSAVDKMGFKVQEVEGSIENEADEYVDHKDPRDRAGNSGIRLQMRDNPNVSNIGLNIRTGPAANCEWVGKLNDGDIIIQLERKGDWVRHEKGWSAMYWNGNQFLYTMASSQDDRKWEGATVVIKNRKSGKYLNVSGASRDNGAQIIQWHSRADLNGRWTMDYKSDGWYAIRSLHSGKVLNVAGANTNRGAKIIQWDNPGASESQWKIVPNGSGWYNIKNRKSGHVLDVVNGNVDSGAAVCQWNSPNDPEANWQLEHFE